MSAKDGEIPGGQFVTSPALGNADYNGIKGFNLRLHVA